MKTDDEIKEFIKEKIKQERKELRELVNKGYCMSMDSAMINFGIEILDFIDEATDESV